MEMSAPLPSPAVQKLQRPWKKKERRWESVEEKMGTGRSQQTGDWKQNRKFTAGQAGEPNPGALQLSRAAGTGVVGTKALAASAHLWPLPDKRQTHTAAGAKEPGKENPGCQPGSSVTSTPKVSERLQPRLSRLFGAQQQRVLHIGAASLPFTDKFPSFAPILFEAISLLP